MERLKRRTLSSGDLTSSLIYFGRTESSKVEGAGVPWGKAERVGMVMRGRRARRRLQALEYLGAGGGEQ
jgi:hypothetical protein